jgi:NADPH:quinone reductase-like Zn-dependent oxidoreductase
MRAIWLRHHGGPEALEAGEAPDPEPRDGQVVVVDVRHANITFVDTVLRAGGPGPMAWSLPVIPGNGVGGEVGGRRVVTTTGGTGGYAERVAVPAAGLIDVPDAVTLDDATALLADGRTALWVLDALAAALDRVRPGGRYYGLGQAGGARPAIDDRPVTAVPWARPTPDQMTEYTARALDECATGRLRPVIGQRFPLEHAATAHAAIGSRATVGKTLLMVRPPPDGDTGS